MEMKRHVALVCMALVIVVFLTSCMTVEGTMSVPIEPVVEEPMVVAEVPVEEPALEEEVVLPVAKPKIDWMLSAQGLEVSIGERITLVLPPDGAPSAIWGDGMYTDDSSIGTAAVHMGLLAFETGGEVTIEIRDGLDSYAGSTRNGVTSTPYAEWGGSFVFLDRNGNEITAP